MREPTKRRGVDEKQEKIPGANKANSKARPHPAPLKLPHNRPNVGPEAEPVTAPPVLSMPDQPAQLPWERGPAVPLHRAIEADPFAREAALVASPLTAKETSDHLKGLPRLTPLLPPPTEKQLGIIDGMTASGATELAIQRRLRWSRGHWKTMLKQHAIIRDTITAASKDDAALCLNALRRAALTASGSMRKHKGALRAMAMYLALKHKLGGNNFNQQNNFNLPEGGGGVLRVNVIPGQTQEQLEAEIIAQQTALIEHAQYVKFDPLKRNEPIDITPKTPNED